jgi:ABC-type phosphate transport system substrate-binding protein
MSTRYPVQSQATPSRRFVVRALSGYLLAIWIVRRERTASADETFRVIVCSANPAATASRSFLADVFLKRTSHWEDGQPLHPADLRPESQVRRNFSEQVLKRSVAAVRNYWQQRIFSGRDVPPPELDSDDAVVRYVATHRGAIGYVSASAKLQDVKVIALK